ncbi:hypothetical protein J2T13_000098 [Paenibacillus sp. DS2015]
MDQLFLPMDLEEDIPQNHLVRLVNAAVNRLDKRYISEKLAKKLNLVDMKFKNVITEAKTARAVR